MPLKMDIVANQAVVDRSLSSRHYVNVWVCVCVVTALLQKFRQIIF